MFSILEICALISHIYFKTIVIDNLHLFRKWRGSSPILRTLVEKLIWILIIVGILVFKWVIKIILVVEMVIIGIHFTKNNIKNSLSLLIER